MIEKLNPKNKKGSNGMVKPNPLKPDYIKLNDHEYLNISTNFNKSCAGMAEWSTQSAETRYPSGCVGSIPTAGATISNKLLKNRIKKETEQGEK